MDKENTKEIVSQKENSFWRYVFSPVFVRGGYIFILFIPVFISFFISIIMVLTANPEKRMYFAKVPIKSVMQSTIKNGGNLRNIKHIYETRNLEGLIFQSIFFPWKLNDYYKENYPLTDILNDLQIDYLQNDSNKDSLYFQALCCIIEENERQNPFDMLEENQKYNFENIQTKLDSVYVKIAPDVIKIADELNNKNQLVSKYLSKSEMSYYISIAAIIISTLFSLFQIIQSFIQRREKEESKKTDPKEEKENDNVRDGTMGRDFQ